LYACRDSDIKDVVRRWSRLVEEKVIEALQAVGCEEASYYASLAVSVCRGTELDLLSKDRDVSEDWMRSRLVKVLSLAA
ncbi:MAG: hypothetical protein WA989_17470, partial [Henriciella sp.]|uniref:hypothetical protein n=1 Tax=Henriciella sp. TaxID=1968823 RepID=UPI003C729718